MRSLLAGELNHAGEVWETIMKVGELSKSLHTKRHGLLVFFQSVLSTPAARRPQKKNLELSSWEMSRPRTSIQTAAVGVVLIVTCFTPTLYSLPSIWLHPRPRGRLQGWRRKGLVPSEVLPSPVRVTMAVTTDSSGSHRSHASVLPHC